jgi:two-component system, NarL family, nitrate/nitrite response regulator NarL
MSELPFRTTIHLAVVAAHAVVRAGLKHLLDNRGNLTIVGEASNIPDALSLLTEKRPDIIVIDPDTADITLQEIAELTSVGAQRVIVFTGQADARLHQRAFELGVLGVVLKSHPVDLLVRAIEKVHAGEVWLDRVKTASLLKGILRQRDPEDAKIVSLTKREREVIDLVGQGLKNRVIGERLFISAATVRNHLTSILGKLELSDRLELAVYSFRHGLVEPETREPIEFNAARVARHSRIQIGSVAR